VDEKCSCDFNFREKGFVHMGAAVEDHGTREDVSQYFATEKSVTFNALQRIFYPAVARISNGNIDRLRGANRREDQ
jgi:hypothetical protein